MDLRSPIPVFSPAHLRRPGIKDVSMDAELLDLLEKRLESLLLDYVSLKQEAARLKEDNQRLVMEREGFKTRIDAILTKLEGI